MDGWGLWLLKGFVLSEYLTSESFQQFQGLGGSLWGWEVEAKKKHFHSVKEAGRFALLGGPGFVWVFGQDSVFSEC